MSTAGGAYAQTTTSTVVRNFEVISVDGNYLVFRDQFGTHDLSVPADFRFNVDGRSLAVGDLKPGMKGTATVTKTTTIRDVYVTEIKKGTVLSQTGKSIVVKEDTGKIHRFSQSEVDERGIQLFVGDRPIRLFNLDAGDQISAKIVTAGPPDVLTQQQVDAILAKPAATVAAAPAPPAEAPAASPPPEPAAEAAPEPVADYAPEPVAEADAAPAPSPAVSEPVEEDSKLWLLDSAPDHPGGRGLAGRALQQEEIRNRRTGSKPCRRGSWASPAPGSRRSFWGQCALSASRSSSACSSGSTARPRSDPIRLSSSYGSAFRS